MYSHITLSYTTLHHLSKQRSSFRTGAPPPPRPIKQFYDKLFWFGFDPDVTGPTDRTMFGGTRGKFNALELLRDREERQERRRMRREREGLNGDGRRIGRSSGLSRNNRRSSRGRWAKDPVIQDFGEVDDWDSRKRGLGRPGGSDVGDDTNFSLEDEYDEPFYDIERQAPRPPPFARDRPPPPPDYDPYEQDDYEASWWDEEMPPPFPPPSRFAYEDEIDFEREDRAMQRRQSRMRNPINQRKKRDRRNSNREENNRGFIGNIFAIPESKRIQAEAYDRFIGLGPSPDEDDIYEERMQTRGQSRRRNGYAYKYIEDEDEEEYIPPVAEYDAQRVDDDSFSTSSYSNNMSTAKSSTTTRLTAMEAPRKRSWEERALEMDRVPPKGAVAWGPNGRASSGGMDAQTKAALDALGEIRKSQTFLAKKEDLVLDAEEEVIALKA